MTSVLFARWRNCNRCSFSLFFVAMLLVVSHVPPLAAQADSAGDSPPQLREFGGVYPHLAYWNDHGECGTGAVVPWSGKLWVITYAPHFPHGSTDKLYSISDDLKLTHFEGSVGGTPANRMIHRETNQLVIGPYVIDDQSNVRVISPKVMPGRLTANARHLFDPENKIYYATMEEGFYEVDMRNLDVVELFADHQKQAYGGDDRGKSSESRLASLPGYHGKGLYSGQGRLVYANNGENSGLARKRPDVASGCLAEWDGKSDQWRVIRRNQFVDVRGPGGIYGNDHPDSDPIWAIGWDHRSLLLMLCDAGEWHCYRMPKASHTYDGAHGWNTEWPRFQDIGEAEFVMNMHGMFWRFPRTFSRGNDGGIRPRSTYLKVIGDYCRWGDGLVFGCDDTAKNEFLNRRKAKGGIDPPGQSHSNLWFASSEILDQLGTPIARGAVWRHDEVAGKQPSDPFLFAGFERRAVFLVNEGDEAVKVTIAADPSGPNQWSNFSEIAVAAGESKWHRFDPNQPGEWVTLTSDRPAKLTAQFCYSNADPRTTTAASIFDGLAQPSATSVLGGVVRVRGENIKKLALVTSAVSDGKLRETQTMFEVDETMTFAPLDDGSSLNWTASHTKIPTGIIKAEPGSVLYVDDAGNRWRLPRGDDAFDQDGPLGPERLDREVVTERDLFNCHGTFYELPARNAGGFAKIRPICTHNRRIHDYCSYRGLLIMTGVDANYAGANDRIVRSADGSGALWAGVIDDLWKFGKPVGTGGPWHDSKVEANVPSDPYLFFGYDLKSLKISHKEDSAVKITAQLDITGDGDWVDFKSFDVPPQTEVSHVFPAELSAYWIRFVAESEMSSATTQLSYK